MMRQMAHLFSLAGLVAGGVAIAAELSGAAAAGSGNAEDHGAH